MIGVRGVPERRIFPACVGRGLRRGFLFLRRLASAGRFPSPLCGFAFALPVVFRHHYAGSHLPCRPFRARIVDSLARNRRSGLESSTVSHGIAVPGRSPTSRATVSQIRALDVATLAPPPHSYPRLRGLHVVMAKTKLLSLGQLPFNNHRTAISWGVN